MRAVLLTGHGDIDRLELRSDLEVPRPLHGEVLVRVRAAAVNNTDINLRSGWYSKSVTAGKNGDASHGDAGWDGTAVKFPRIQGADGCGTIVAVGAGVDPARIGLRVLIDPIVRNTTNGRQSCEYIGTDRDGCFAEFVTVPASNAVSLQSSMTDIELASFPCSGIAAENMLTRACVQAGDRILITGASGGVGSAAVQLAKRRGAQIIAIAAKEKTAALLALGVTRVLARDANLGTELGDNSLDAIIDCVGGSQFSAFLNALRPGGRYAVAGAIAGPIVELDLRTLYLKDLSFFGCTVAAPEVFGALVRHIEAKEIRPIVAQVFPLAELAAAQQHFLSKRHTGKVVIEI